MVFSCCRVCALSRGTPLDRASRSNGAWHSPLEPSTLTIYMPTSEVRAPTARPSYQRQRFGLLVSTSAVSGSEGNLGGYNAPIWQPRRLRIRQSQAQTAPAHGPTSLVAKLRATGTPSEQTSALQTRKTLQRQRGSTQWDPTSPRSSTVLYSDEPSMKLTTYKSFPSIPTRGRFTARPGAG